jgi:hypothetical protein
MCYHDSFNVQALLLTGNEESLHCLMYIIYYLAIGSGAGILFAQIWLNEMSAAMHL